MDIKVQFGKTLRALRLKKAMTQEDVAFASGLNVTYVSDLERGLYNPSLAVLVELGKALGEHPATLIAELEIGRLSTAGRRRRQ